MRIWKIRISFRLWPLNEEENNEWILLTSVCRSLSARPPLSENQLSGKIIESAHSMSVRAGACYKMWTAQWRLPITMKSIFTLIIKYVVSSCICHIHVLHICHGIHSFRGILRNDSSGESSVLTFFMPINSTIITFYCAFIFIEKCLIVKSAHEHTFHPYRCFRTSFHQFSFSCLFMSACGRQFYICAGDLYRRIHTNTHKKFETWTIYSKSINSQIDCSDWHFFSYQFFCIRFNMYHKSNSGPFFFGHALDQYILFLWNRPIYHWQHSVILVVAFFMHELFPQRLDIRRKVLLIFSTYRMLCRDGWAKSYFWNRISRTEKASLDRCQIWLNY